MVRQFLLKCTRLVDVHYYVFRVHFFSLEVLNGYTLISPLLAEVKCAVYVCGFVKAKSEKLIEITVLEME